MLFDSWPNHFQKPKYSLIFRWANVRIFSSTTTMDYNWLTSVGDHDPITIDANLAEIDFDDFKNEDIQNAYAFSLQSYVSTIYNRCHYTYAHFVTA